MAVGGVNTVVSLVVRVPSMFEGPDGTPEVALGYDVSATYCSNQLSVTLPVRGDGVVICGPLFTPPVCYLSPVPSY